MSTGWKSWLEPIKNATIIFTCVSLIIGIIVGVQNLSNSFRSLRFAGLEQAKELVKAEETIKDSVFSYVQHRSASFSEKEIDSLLRIYRTGQAIYYSGEFRSFRTICHHYETVGAFVSAGYVDFDLYFELVPFPDQFYDTTATLRNAIRENWNGEGKPLSDFLANFEGLRARYLKLRNMNR